MARTDGFTVNATTTTTLAVLANDYSGPAVNGATSEPTDTITVKSVGTASRGTLSIAAGGTGVVYDPTGCGTGGDSFTYTITDSRGLTATATAFVTIARPGTNGLSINPITDMPAIGLVSNSTISSTVPMRLSWCGVTKAGASVRSCKVAQSTNGGSTYPTTLYSSTTGTGSTRNLAVSTTYRWRARTVDSAGRTGSYRYSLTARVARYQESSSTITYSGTWGTTKSTSYSGGAQRYTGNRGCHRQHHPHQRAPVRHRGAAVINTGQLRGLRGRSARGHGEREGDHHRLPTGALRPFPDGGHQRAGTRSS